MRAGVPYEKLEAVNRYETSDLFSEREKMALAFAEGVVFTDRDISDEFFAALQKVFSDRALVELAATVVIEDLLSKFNHAFLVESQGFCSVPARNESG
jgi:alkylhydroperoxidase family enzyme